MGIHVAAINYRYAGPESPLPASLYDSARAIQFLRHKAEEWKIDRKRIGTYGGSAGGCTSMWLAFHDDLADPDSDDPVARESTRLTCIAPGAGQSSVDPNWIAENFPGADPTKYEPLPHINGVETFEDLEKPEVRKRIEESSAINHLTKDDPPVYMTYKVPNEPITEKTSAGTIIHHPLFGVRLKEKMDALGIENVLVIRDKPEGKDPYGDMHAFFRAKLLGESPAPPPKPDEEK
jgi:hypothetical protein